MSFDGSFCAAIVSELKEKISGSKIEKIHNPEKDRLNLSIYSPKYITKHSTLIISLNPSLPQLRLGEADADNPSTPSAFCMLLRKHLTSAILTDITQYSYDRILFFEFLKQNELGYQEKKYLCLEIMGKYSNAFILDQDKKILGSLKSADITESKRLTLTGATYIAPEQDKINPMKVTKDQFEAAILQNREQRADSLLLKSFTGFSPLISREIVYRASKATDTQATFIDIEKLWFHFSEILHSATGGQTSPCIVFDKNDKIAEYSFVDLYQYGSLVRKSYTDLCELQAALFEKKSKSEHVNSRKQDILKLLANRSSKLGKILALKLDELAECVKMEEFKKNGDLITNSIYMIKQGQAVAALPDYETGETIKVALDTKLSPAANAQKYYKRYQKLRHAEKVQKEMIAQTKVEIDYLDTIFDALSRAETERELEDIRDELAANNYTIQKRKTALVQKTKKSEPLSFRTTNGYSIRVGKNNIQNDMLTFSADKNDIWFHVRNMSGSHVILYTEGTEPTEKDYTEASELAAFYSKSNGAENTAVDYTKRRFVKKPSGSKPGYVTYDKYFTAVVSPSADRIEAMKIKKKQ
ncbi:MAG: hypothetical protein A2Y17_03925 [Clostridiales bacterium GWF2_38_85]|nr:MAG: hypothetical protein A2Y17_03925 [Clostridiales bacterium GWF2_38_85]HBL83944.1 hypothetical protein [Clostridiales bacterium]